MAPTYREGDLVRFVRFENKWTLCGSFDREPRVLREFPVKKYEVYASRGSTENFNDFEGRLGLIVSIQRNHLDQPLGYQILVGKNTWFCKSVIAEKYFNVVENPGDESR